MSFYAGGSETCRRACLSHTGALAGPDRLYDGVFRQSGIIRARSIAEMFDFCYALGTAPLPRGNRVLIQTHSGGPGAAAADACGRAGLELPRADLVGLGYLLGELEPPLRTVALEAAEAATDRVLVVEPGTPRGFAAVLAARDQLVGHGWHVLAPCPQDGPCPVAARAGDWCHFSARLDRTALHRRLKDGARSYEDEKLAFVLAVRHRPSSRPAARVLRHPFTRKGLVRLEVCRSDGSAGTEVVTRRDRDAYRAARDIRWGDTWP